MKPEPKDEDERCRWITEYPSDRQKQITAAYRLAVAVVQTDDWLDDWKVREAQKTAFAEYVDMRDTYRRMSYEREIEISEYRS
jgi:hypothetical protein